MLLSLTAGSPVIRLQWRSSTTIRFPPQVDEAPTATSFAETPHEASRSSPSN